MSGGDDSTYYGAKRSIARGGLARAWLPDGSGHLGYHRALMDVAACDPRHD
jgi:hypothetical protein